MEIVLPYFLSSQRQIEIPNQHPFRPHYQAAQHSRQLFSRVYSPNSDSAKELFNQWLAVKDQNSRLQNFLAPIHEELIDALILEILHKYTEESLSPKAKYDWWKVDLPAVKLEKEDLPDKFRKNRFLAALWKNSEDWKLLLPAGTDIQVESLKDSWSWILKHRWFGEVKVTCYRPPWVSKLPSQPGRILGEGLGNIDQDDLMVLGTRVYSISQFRFIFLPSSDKFHEWVSGLLEYLDEGLSWNYFLASLPDRMVVDLPWKIGDLPDKNSSLWNKLLELEERLKDLEAKS